MDFPLIPDRIAVNAAKALDNLVPKKSKDVYDKEYERFGDWMKKNDVKIINETVLLGYFQELSGTFTPNSLWTKYSMLKKTLIVNKNIDIAKYCKLGQYLKQTSKGYEARKSKILTREEVLKFIREAPNETFLMYKVALLFGVFGGCRRQELVNMLVEHIEDRGSVVIVNIPETKTDKKRVFTIIDEKEMGCLKLLRTYWSLRPTSCNINRFFLCYRNGRCFSQPVGKNTIGKIPSIIAKYLGLSDADKYTGHCLRRTSATLLADAGANMTTLKRHGGWKSSAVVEGYLEDSMSSKNKISKLIAGVPSTRPSTSTNVQSSSISVSENHEVIENIDLSKAGKFVFTGSFHNCSFNINDT